MGFMVEGAVDTVAFGLWQALSRPRVSRKPVARGDNFIKEK
jgi:hypothetical protein